MSKRKNSCSTKRIQRLWFQLLFHAINVVLAGLTWLISNSNLITLAIFIFGSLATELISEKTLVKVLPWNRRK